jgi:ribosomal protein S27E
MNADRELPTTIPHSDFGDPECWGCLNGIIRGEIAVIECNECGTIIRTVAAGELQKALHEMELTLDIASAACVHCGAVHLRPCLSRLLVFTSEECGTVTKLSCDPDIERLFQ